MIDRLDQIFVLLKHWILGYLPVDWQIPAGVILSVVCIIGLYPALFALTTVLERKGVGRIQNRLGPNRVGPFGILQPMADGIKSLTKEDIVPTSADAVVHFLAPVILVVTVFMGFAVMPMGKNMVLVDMDAGLLFYFAMGASSELSVFMAGWGSRNKYSLLGAMRAVAQMISYEVALLLSSVVIVMMTGSLSLVKIVEAQNHYSYGLPHWFIFTPWGFAGFLMYAIAGTAETNRSPLICRRANRNWWRGITRSIRASSLRCSFWASMWRCSRSRDWVRRCSWVDGQRLWRCCSGFRRGYGSLGSCLCRCACSSGYAELCRG
jgi:NADH-quinone oxidoreductase subunit H